MYDIQIDDDLTESSWTLDSLLSGYDTIFYTTYVVIQSDIDAGSIMNIATATGKDGEGNVVNSRDSVKIGIEQNAGMLVYKQAVDTTELTLGAVIVYEIIVTNTGNVALTNITVSDPNADEVSYVSGDENDNDTLDVGESWVYEATHTITESDIEAGYVDNVATGSGTISGGGSSSGSSNTVRVDVEDCDLFIPNIFSPNGDDVHDYLQIRCIENYTNARMQIYNCWGQLV